MDYFVLSLLSILTIDANQQYDLFTDIDMVEIYFLFMYIIKTKIS